MEDQVVSPKDQDKYFLELIERSECDKMIWIPKKQTVEEFIDFIKSL